MRRTFYTLLTILIIGLGSLSLKAQDIHYTLFDHSYLTTNPALTGSFNGSFRIGGILRDQWFSILPNEFVTPSFYLDAPIIRGFRKQDWVGVGITFYNDEVGIGSLKSTGFYGSVAYHFSLDDDNKSVFTIGAQGGSVNRSVDATLLIFEDNLLGGGGVSQDVGNIDNTSYVDISAGALFKSLLNDETKMTIGFAVNHIGNPSYNLSSADENTLPMLATLHGGLAFQLNDTWDLNTGIYAQRISGATTVSGQGVLGYRFDEEREITLRGGLGYRAGDAFQVILGADIKSLRLAAAYDLTTSGLSSASGNQGAFEVAVSYIGKIFKKPEVKPTVLCPDL
ncbi:MAG: PorP/SprF family type IX secretion system membrane protein [Bacteroidia bacterium]|nr:PorP/SprF family type IX secretion system membrane protein [Bacteroidia bacterium]